MLNQVILVGRLVRDPEIQIIGDKKLSNITLAVTRSYKNEDGIYETDFVECELWNLVATNTAEYCKKGDMIGVKGRLKTDIYMKDDINIKQTKIIAEKISFLSSKKENT